MSENDPTMPVVYDSRRLPIDSVEPNLWNPNKMDEKEFNRLATEVSNVGFTVPIQVVPMQDGKFRIVGGEHRWRVAKALGMTEVPAIVLSEEKWKDEDLQKFVTVRLQVIQGKLDPEKMLTLYNQLAEKYGEDAMASLMGFTEESALKKYVGEARSSLKDAGLPEEMLQKFDDMKKEVKTIDDLSVVLNKLFNEYGDTLDQNFMVFTYGSKEHLYIACDKVTYEKAKAVADRSKLTKVDINEFMHRAFEGWDKRCDGLPTEAPAETPSVPPPSAV